ncbi:hypothetical protein ACJMK2_039226 [Sinanodonta woodiana]|uniref:Poly [ADP-ribose] polymerase n=1 Tax=Sinanodonta woodiana TaxID=1069815 RepID=A0ABD3WDC4_SINWO
MDLIDANKKSVTLMKYIGPFTPIDPASDSKHWTNIFVSKGSQNLEKNPMIIGTNTSSDVKISHQKLLSADEDSNNKNSENHGIVIKSNMTDRSRVGLGINGKKTLTNLCTNKTCIDVSASDQLKANLGTAGINKAVKQCTNLSGGLVDVNLPNKSFCSLTAGESSHLSSNIIGMSGIKMAATPHLDHVTSKHGTKFSLAKSQYSITSGLMDVQNLRSELSGTHLGIRKGDSDLQGLALLDPKINIAVGGCVLETTGLDAGGKLNQGKVKVNPESLNKGNTGIPLPAIFANCQFALDLSMNMSFSEKTNLRKAITSHGGIVSFIVTKKTTHIVCSDPEKADTSYKCKMATKYGIPIICVDYVRNCVDKGRLLNTDGYLLMGKTKAEELKLGKISASRQQKQETKQKVKPMFNVKNVKLWTYGEKDCPNFDEENYQIAKYAMFKKLDKSTETTTFCVLELHVVDIKVDGTSEHRFRVFCHHGVLHDIEEGQAGNKEIRFAQTSEEVVAIYVHLYHEQMKPPHSMTLTFDLLSRHVGSQKFKQMMAEIGAECGVISPAVCGLVNYVWEEAVGNLQQNLRGPLTSIKIEQIDKAEGILKQMREAVDEENTVALFELKDKFYKEIPYQQTVSISEINKAWISRTFDLCQLIRDLIAVSEATDWSIRASDEAKYSALRCNIEHLESTSPEFKIIKDYLMQSLDGGMSLKVERIFHVHRLAESSNFRMDLEPRKLLFHSSRVDNFMGILSRGLLMPRVVVDDHGGKRTDPGMLGSGIYFAEAGSTSAGYSSPGKTKGTRLMLINEVALGSCFGTTKHNKSLTEPPEGYQSVHGIKATENCPSDFKVDEYVVYNTNQQRIKYLVEFTLPGDVVIAQDVGSVFQNQQLFAGGMDMDELDDLSLREVDLKDVAGVIDPVTKVKAGLVSSGDAPVDLKQVHISARLLDMVSQVAVIQEYSNNSSSPLEAKYVFPLDEMAVVCGFEAFINGKHIIGEVKEKETAHKEYKKAISEGHGAYLMDQDEETPDVFTISVGNLPPWATVFIKITYVAELQVEDELISFRLPGSVAPWSKDAALQDKTQSDIATVEVKQGKTSLLITVEMPFDIRTIECPTHKINLKKTLTKAVVGLCDEQSLSDGFQLLIGLAEIHVPRMWVERKGVDSDHQACMLSFYPEFEASQNEEADVIFLLDLSNSMKGAALTQAKKVLLLTLTHIPKQWTFNVIVFGTGYRELFPGGVCKTPDNVKKVDKFVQGLKADMGNTEALRPLHSLHLLKRESSLRNVFLITDGHVNNEETTLAEIQCHCQNTRIFTFGISSTANRHLLRALARMGGGAFEFFDPKSKSKWEGKVKSQISKAGHIGLTSISVHWEQYDSDVASPVQAPKNINAIFSGSRQVIYGFVPNCTMATLKAQIDGQEVSTVVSTSDLNITEGKILHRLTARAIIRDWEDGLLSLDRADQEIMKATTKNLIIELSKEYSIVTQFTSFVAIEKRDEDKEVDESELLDMSDLIEREAADNLQSMGYISFSSSSSSSDESEILLKCCSVPENVLYDLACEEWGGGGGGMSLSSAEMEMTLCGEEAFAYASTFDAQELEMKKSLRSSTHSESVKSGEEFYECSAEEWQGGGGGGGGMPFSSAEMLSTLSGSIVDDSATLYSSLEYPRDRSVVQSAKEESTYVEEEFDLFEGEEIILSAQTSAKVVQSAEEEEAYEDIGFGLFEGDDISLSASSSAKDSGPFIEEKKLTPGVQKEVVQQSLKAIFREQPLQSHGGESADQEMFKKKKKKLLVKESRGLLRSVERSADVTVEAGGLTAQCYSEIPVKLSSNEYSGSMQPKMSPQEGEAVFRQSALQSSAMSGGVHPFRKSSTLDFHGNKEIPQAGILFKSMTLVQPEIQPTSLFGSAPSQSHVSIEGHDTSQRQTVFGFGVSSPSISTATLASQQMFPGQAAFELAVPTSSFQFGSQSEKMSQKELEDGFKASSLSWSSKSHPVEESQIHSMSSAPVPQTHLAFRTSSTPADQATFQQSWSVPQGHAAFGSSLFAPSGQVTFQQNQSVLRDRSVFKFEQFKSGVRVPDKPYQPTSLFGSAPSQSHVSMEGRDTSQRQTVFGFGVSSPSISTATLASQQMFPGQAAFGLAVPKPSFHFGSQSSEKMSQKELEEGLKTSSLSWLSKSQPLEESQIHSMSSAPVPQTHLTFGSSSTPADQATFQQSWSVPQGHAAFGSSLFAPSGQGTVQQNQSVPLSHPTFGFASSGPRVSSLSQQSRNQPLFETLSAPFINPPKVENRLLIGSSLGVAQGEKDKFEELQPEPPVLQAPPIPPPPPPHPICIRSMYSSSVREPNLTGMENKMMDSPVLQQKQSHPPPLPKIQRYIHSSLMSDFECHRASPPPPPLLLLPHSAKEMSPLPPPPLANKMSLSIPKQRLKQLDILHSETEERSYQYSIDTLPQVSWRTCTVPAVKSMVKRSKKSEESELTGAFERIQSRSLGRMELEPLSSLDKMEESVWTEEDLLGEAVTTDLGQYGIGVNVECIAVSPMRQLPDNTIECIMKLQKEDGHWEFDADMERILSVDRILCMQILYTSGLKSMGESAVQAISQLVATLIVLFSIYKYLFPSTHMTNLRQVDEQNNTYNKIRTAMSKLGFGHQIDSAMSYCNIMKRQYSMVPATLELGKSWEEIVGKMLGIHCEIYITHF